MAEKITKAPSTKVYSLSAPSRVSGSYGMKSSYKIPAAAKDTKKKDRAEQVECEWELGMGLNTKNKNGTTNYKNPKRTETVSINYTGDITAWLNSGWKWSNGFNNVTRKTFYPCTKHKLYNIHLRVRLKNSKGRGAANYVYKAFEKPKTPSLGNLTQDAQTGGVSATVKWDKDWNGVKEAYDCKWRVEYLDTSVSKKPTVTEGSREGTEFTLYRDATNRMNLTYDQYIKVTYEVWARGFAGDSPHAKKSLVISYPAKASIKGIDAPSKDATAKVTVRITTAQSAEHPVTGAKLQILRDTDYKKASDIPSSAVWEDTDAVDNGTTSALALGVADIIPAAGKTSWVRVKTWNQVEGIFYRYSEPRRVTALESPLQTTSEIELLSLGPGADGESAVALIGWDKDGQDDWTGTELTWSEDENAWKSTDSPDDYSFTWEDGAVTHEGMTYNQSATVYIKGLKENTLYYVRARRYREADTTTYSEYSNTLNVIPTTAPSSVTLTVPPFIERGKGLALTWTYDSESTQRAWEVVQGDIVVAEGTDSLGSCVIPAERLTSLLGDDDSITLAVRVSTGGEFVQSTEQSVRIADAPTLELTVPATLTEQAPTIEVTSNVASAVALVLRANGMQSSYPDGTRTQTFGDTLYSAVITPAYIDFITYESENPLEVVYTTTSEEVQYDPDKDYATVTEQAPAGDRYEFEYPVLEVLSVTDNGEPVEYNLNDGTREGSFTLPAGLDFWDGADYTLTASAIAPETGLTSPNVTHEIHVTWAHQAPDPGEIILTPMDEEDEDGVRRKYVVLQMVPPTGAAATDEYDIYRVTPDRAYLVATGVPLDAEVTDYYAPYGGTEKAYRVATRTADGDVTWLDFPYELDGRDLRVDFGSQYVELPYNLVIGDTYTKDFESRAHLGEGTPQGYWNDSVTRTASLNTDVFKVEEQGKQATLRDLAAYSGACFVRTPNGCAYQANVDVKGLDWKHSTAFAPVSLDATEVGLTQKFMADVPLPEGE